MKNEHKCDECDDGTRPRSHTNVPLPAGYIAVERCDACEQYDSDIEAAQAIGTHAQWMSVGCGSGLNLAAICKPSKIEHGDTVQCGICKKDTTFKKDNDLPATTCDHCAAKVTGYFGDRLDWMSQADLLAANEEYQAMCIDADNNDLFGRGGW